jgi:hypothetical protein
MSMRHPLVIIAGLPLALGLAGAASANQINTGGEKGAYHATFCPQLEAELKKAKFDYSCTTSEGSRENIRRVSGEPTQVGFTQFDVFELELQSTGSNADYAILRDDLARECLFMVTSNQDITNYGEVAALADQLSFVLPPENSGSAGTFEYLQQIDPDGLGRVRSGVTHADSTEDALAQALTNENTVALFVQFPDPKNERFKMIADKGGSIVPVIDRNILRQEVNGQKIYYAEETEIELPKWNKSAKKVVTACTPMVLFTGATERLDDGNARKDQEDLIRTVKALKAEQLQPKVGFLASVWRKTKALSAKSVEKMISASEKAREAAKPMMEKAMQRAKEMKEQAEEAAGNLLEDGSSQN